MAHRASRTRLRRLHGRGGPGDLSALHRWSQGRGAPAGGRGGHRQGEPPGQGRDSGQPDRPSLRRGRSRERRGMHRARLARRGDPGGTRCGRRGDRGQGLLPMKAPSGILPVGKVAGMTSFQVVAHLRRLMRAAKIGHGGTLDPDATGVLPILVGEATKLTPYLIDLDKEYVATIRLGIVTDTQDLSGTVLHTLAVPLVDAAAIEAVLGAFVGVIRQVPPMYSALHHGGKRLY